MWIAPSERQLNGKPSQRVNRRRTCPRARWGRRTTDCRAGHTCKWGDGRWGGCLTPIPEAVSERARPRAPASGLDGLDVMREVLAIDRRARILVLTSLDGDHDITRALRAGAKGYLSKHVPPAAFLTAVRAVHAGRSVVPPEIATRVAEHLTSEPLTPRELEVLRRLAEGKANKVIAYELKVSEGTAKTHVGNILQKLCCGSRAEAVAVAVRRGFLHL